MIRVQAILLLLPVCLLSGCGGGGTNKAPEVVVYTALDRGFSEPIFKDFEAETGIRVLPKFDTESTKTVGLVNAIRAEKSRPRCDVFWNNEIVNTLRLKHEGLLEPHGVPVPGLPPTFKDRDGTWTGFAARARVLLVNTNLVAEADAPASLHDLADPKWKGRIGIAKPLFGTTASHVACLFAELGEEQARALLQSFKDNGIQVLSGNKDVATSVSAGRIAAGLTDTDDAIIEVEAGQPVRIVYLDTGSDQLGTLFIPNTLSLVKGAPHPGPARKLITYLLRADVERKLAEGPSAQIPLIPGAGLQKRVKTPSEIKAMAVDFEEAAKQFEKAAAYIEQEFLK